MPVGMTARTEGRNDGSSEKRTDGGPEVRRVRQSEGGVERGVPQGIELWCNGNTTDSGPVFPGSSPGSSTQRDDP